MLKIALVAGGDKSHLPAQFDYYVGIDRGSLFLLEKGLPLTMAIGDFDSVSDQELSLIKSKAEWIYQAPIEKDDTDTELALKIIFETYPDAQVTIFGAFGGRLDHALSNLFLPSEPALAPYMEQIGLVDEQNYVSFRPEGQHVVEPLEGMTYISFIPEGGNLNIYQAKYELRESNFFSKKVYASNEFMNQPIKITVSAGYLVIIQTRDKKL